MKIFGRDATIFDMWLLRWLGIVGAILMLLVGSASARAVSSSVLIVGVYFDAFGTGEGAEAMQLQNVGDSAVDLNGWAIGDGEGQAAFGAGVTLEGGGKVWGAKSAQAFLGEFGFLPDYEFGGDSEASVPDMTGTALSMGNEGDKVWVKDALGNVVDAVVYGNGSLDGADWLGAGIAPYDFGSASVEGQILFRKRHEADGMPVADSDSAADWAQDASDSVLGKKVLYPGWDADTFFDTVKSDTNAALKFCVAPDGLFACLRDEIAAAADSIVMEMYSFDSANLLDVILARLDAGVEVSILLDGAALETQGKWVCAQIEEHGGECWLMASKPQANVHKRYDSQHGKWIVLDGARVLIGSENLGMDALPADDQRDGTRGTRGGYVITDNPEIVAAASAILDADFDSAHHADVRRWGTSADDFPPLDFVPTYEDGGKGYGVKFGAPLVLSDAVSMELVQCPDNCLRTTDGLLGMIGKAGAGDTVLAEQLYEYLYWGNGTSNRERDPNLRLEAYVAAARRGARVRVLLDSYYDTFSEPRSNYSTCAYLNSLRPMLDLECRLANPTGLGIHLKMVLVDQGETGFVHLGSINGSETSNKLNREVALQVESRAAVDYWNRVFAADWEEGFASHRVFLPMVGR